MTGEVAASRAPPGELGRNELVRDERLVRRKRAWRRWTRNWSARVGTALLALVAIAALGAEVLAPYGPDERDRESAAPSGPSWRHWLGVDADQKDVFSRVLHGSRLSLLAGLVSMGLAVTLGVPLGIVAGVSDGWLDALIMRGIDVTLAFPSILIALVVATAFMPGWAAIILAVGLISVPMFVRQIRATVLTIRHLDYVLASRALGASAAHVWIRVILPGVVPPTLILAALGLGGAVLEVAGLSFLGLGGDPTNPEWGSMLAQAKEHLSQSYWPALGPGLAICILILGLNLVGDALRDAWEVRAD